MPTADFFVYLFQYVNELRSVTDALPRKPRKDEGSYVLSIGIIASLTTASKDTWLTSHIKMLYIKSVSE